MSNKKIKSALISVFHKDGLKPVLKALYENNVMIYSTGGTEKFIKDLNIPVTAVEDITSYPSILGGRVKTLHPKIFGGILNRQDHEGDISEMKEFDIPQIDLVIVDLYPFEKTVASEASEQDIIEKVDIGGISLIRASAKNFKDTFTISSMNQYEEFLELFIKNNGSSSLSERKKFAAKSFNISSHYDTAIFNYFNEDEVVYKASETISKTLRYGENPHQKGYFFGDLDAMFNKLHGKELSYNNLLDIDAAVNLMSEFINEKPTFAILKHNNACGFAQRNTISKAYVDALAGDPVSAFGGILISNTKEYKINTDLISFISHQIEFFTGSNNSLKELSSNKAFEWTIVSQKLNNDLVKIIKKHLLNENIDLNIISTDKERKKKLLLADMDSTIIMEESLDELAKLIGLEKEVSKITSDAMNGKIDFEQALIKRVSMLKNQPITIFNELKKNIKLNIGAKELIKTMNSNGATPVLISGGFTFLTNYLKDFLGFHYSHANILKIEKAIDGSSIISGKVEYPILDKNAKGKFLENYVENLNINFDDALCVGDGANDIEMIKKSGLGVSYNGKDILNNAANVKFKYTNLKGLLYVQGISDKEIIT